MKLRLNLDPTLPHVVGDRVQLQQVVLNLLINAIEAIASVDGDDRELQMICVAKGAACRTGNQNRLFFDRSHVKVYPRLRRALHFKTAARLETILT